jgi:hypothetical protein
MQTGKGCRLVVACLLLLAAASPAGATEEIAEREDLECQTCHAGNELELLTDEGRYYQYLGSLDGFDRVMDRFGSCAYCHVQEYDSMQFTPEGHRFRWMMEDMNGLKAWLEENHPKPAEADKNDS